MIPIYFTPIFLRHVVNILKYFFSKIFKTKSHNNHHTSVHVIFDILNKKYVNFYIKCKWMDGETYNVEKLCMFFSIDFAMFLMYIYLYAFFCCCYILFFYFYDSCMYSKPHQLASLIINSEG